MSKSDFISLICQNNVDKLSTSWDKFTKYNFKDTIFAIPYFLFFSKSRDHYMTPYLNASFCKLPTSSLTLMHIAAFCDSLEIFIFLQKKGLPIDLPSKESYYPIHYASLNGSSKVVEYILSVDPTQATILPPVDFHLILLATVSKKPNILQLLFKNGADPKAPENKNNQPAMAAIRIRNIECLKVLLENGVKNEIDRMGYSLLMMAVACNAPEAVHLLVEYGEDLEYINEKTYETALTLACFQGFRSIVQYFCDRMNKVDIDPCVRKKAIVHYICDSKDPEIVKIVLSKGINVNRLDENGHTGVFDLLDLTNENTMIEIISLLYENGLDLNIQGVSIKGEKVNTILGDLVASIHRPIKVIDWLLKHGANPNATMFPLNKLIIDIVKTSKNRKLLEVFQDNVPELMDHSNRRLRSGERSLNDDSSNESK